MTAPSLNAALIAQLKSDDNAEGLAFFDKLKSVLKLSDAALLHQLGRLFSYPVLSMLDLHTFTAAFEKISYPEAAKRNCLIVRNTDQTLLLVLADPFDKACMAWASVVLGTPYEVALADRADIAAYLSRYEDTIRASDSLLQQDASDSVHLSDTEVLSIQKISEDANPVIKLVNSTLYDALKFDVSDIHLESNSSGMVIKYRIDGVLSVVGTYAGVAFAEQIISRIKVMSELDISERRVPQDGRFKIQIQGREVDFRVSIMPSSHGEDAVLRILDRKAITAEFQQLALSHLGFVGATLASIKRLIAMPYGMFLVTGPTGSGKTTTLYAAISEINKVQDKIITIEDPVEYQLNGVLQIPVNEKKGLTFARGLRSILRHDPDKIMVGEIRDPETAQIAVQSALTGHLVFTTVHANNAFDVISRFIHMGVDPYSFVSALNGVLAQRLVRINCPHCAVSVSPDSALLADSGISQQQAESYQFKQGQGCGHCRGVGYRGRKVVSELLVLDDQLRQMIVNHEPIMQIKAYASEKGMQSIRQSALALVKLGETTLEEINRVSFVA
ncbi:MAG TPA: GspE/PulE family protein [Methylotenera sp.]|nr:GspE/PulE family protein [Methylotenera sp.]HQO16736.1 GspE/PulE family protein [Methylotenera sp.]